MSLSCEEELYRHLRVVHDGIKPVEIGEEQCSTLVGGETSCKTDGKHVVAEGLLDGDYLTWRIVVRHSRIRKLLLDNPDKSLLELFSGIPYLLIGNLVDSFEAFLVVVMCLELWPEHLGVDGLPFLGSPCRIMHAIGYIADIQLLREIARIHVGEDILAHLAVEH